jgi:hypothetical protein
MIETRFSSLGSAFFVMVLALGACDGGNDDGEMDTGDDDAMMSFCEDEDRADAFTAGLRKTGERATLTVVDAVPAMPGRGDNVWTLAVTDASGAPMEGETLDAKPWMPDHGHGTPVEEQVTDLGGGEYEITSLNLFMPGLWVVTLDVTNADDETDEVVISVCIE